MDVATAKEEIEDLRRKNTLLRQGLASALETAQALAPVILAAERVTLECQGPAVESLKERLEVAGEILAVIERRIAGRI